MKKNSDKIKQKKENFIVHLPSPVKAYTENIGRSRVPSLLWEVPEWDLAETGRLVDIDSYAKRAFRVKRNLFLKEGFEIVSHNPIKSKYIKERLRQFEFATQKPLPKLLSETIDSLIRCSNAFWVKARNEKASGGKKRIFKNKEISPVSGYFLLPAETIQIKRDGYGTVKKYRQCVYGKEEVDFNPEDVIHFYFDKREGFSIGVPSITPVKDDIRALRRIEENVEMLIYQHLFPLFHYKIGTESSPASTGESGVSEVKEVQYKVERMPADGCWVTSERHEIKAIGAASPPVDPEKIMNHFKQRIFTGLGVSPVDMGEGGTSSRSTAQTLSRNLIDDTKADQKDFGSQFFLYVIIELLLESSFDQETLFNEEELVFLKFKEIDFASRQSKENHLVDIFLKNAITHHEMRVAMGYSPFEGEGWPTALNKQQMFTRGQGDWANTHYGIIERDRVLLQSLDEPGTEVSKEEAGSRTELNNSKAKEVSKEEAGSRTKLNNSKAKEVKLPKENNRSVSNKNQPENQYGKRSSTKVNHDLENLKRIFNPLKDKNNIDIDKEFVELKRLVKNSFRSGLLDSKADPFDIDENKYTILIDNYFKTAESGRKKQFNLLSENIEIKKLFPFYKKYFKEFAEQEIYRAFLFGQISGLLEKEKEVVLIDRDTPVLKINKTNAIIYRELAENLKIDEVSYLNWE